MTNSSNNLNLSSFKLHFYIVSVIFSCKYEKMNLLGNELSQHIIIVKHITNWQLESDIQARIW